MDMLGYAAFSGMERVAIILGALVIGYWGYRLYARGKAPGLIFMGIACAVLVAALATGGSHLRSIGASYQLTGSGPGTEAEQTDQGAKITASTESATTVGAQRASGANGEQSESAADATEGATVSASLARDIPGADTSTATPSVADPAPAPAAADQPSEPEVTLASSQELGGRIVAVKSENVTLEWSREAAEPAAQ